MGINTNSIETTTRHHISNFIGYKSNTELLKLVESEIRSMENHPSLYPDFKLINVSVWSTCTLVPDGTYDDPNRRSIQTMYNATITFSITEPVYDNEEDLDIKILKMRFRENMSTDVIAQKLGIYHRHVLYTIEYYNERPDLRNEKLNKS